MKTTETLATTLAFDTSTPNASIALMHNGILTQASLAQQTHAKALVPTIETLLNKAKLTMSDVKTIATTVGPGSFTGIRIGLATAQGLCLAREHTFKTCTSLQAVAAAFFAKNTTPRQCEVWLNAGKAEAYTQIFERTETLLPHSISDISLKPLTDVSAATLATTGNISGIQHAVTGVDAAVICHLAPHLEPTSLTDTAPVYVRAPDAKRPVPLAWLANNA